MSALVGDICSVCCHMPLALAFMLLYTVFIICDCYCPFFTFFIFVKAGIETPDRNGQWYQLLLTLFAIFYESNTEGTNFRIMFVCNNVSGLYNVHALCYTRDSPETTHHVCRT